MIRQKDKLRYVENVRLAQYAFNNGNIKGLVSPLVWNDEIINIGIGKGLNHRWYLESFRIWVNVEYCPYLLKSDRVSVKIRFIFFKLPKSITMEYFLHSKKVITVSQSIWDHIPTRPPPCWYLEGLCGSFGILWHRQWSNYKHVHHRLYGQV